MKLQSLRSKLLVGFLAYSMLGISIVALALWNMNKTSRLNELATRTDGLVVQCLELLNYEQIFTNSDLIDPRFFETSTSENLEMHNAAFSQVVHNLEALKTNTSLSGMTAAGERIQDYLNRLSNELNLYGESFSSYVALNKERGFKDFGLVGQMRESAHAIEDHPEGIALLDLLMLRRHEKDYIIRKDQQYADQFLKLSGRLRQQLRTSGEYPKTLRSLEMYERDFSSLVEIEAKIGTNLRGSGVLSRMRKHSDALGELAADLSKVLTQEVTNLRESNITFFIFLIIAGLTASIIFALLLSGYITRPIRKLADVVRFTARSGFSEEVKLATRTSKDEVGRLSQDFEKMIDKLGNQVAEINSQSERIGRKNAELEALNQQLQHSEQELQRINDVKDKVFSIISHDFRSPLHSLTAYLDLFQENVELFSPDQLQTFISNTREKVRVLISVLENTLKWSLSQSGNLDFNPEQVNLHQLALEGSALHADWAKTKGIELVNQIPEQQEAWADKGMVQFIFRNLVSNSLKFSHRGSRIFITSAIQQDKVVVSVQDTGVGMSQEQIAKVLDQGEFYSSTGTYNEKGTGFGMTLIQQFAAENGGTLQIDSKVGQGTKVSFDLSKAIPA